MSGDIQNHYENFKKQLKKIDFKDQFTFDYVQDNNPTFFLRLLHYILVEYNPNFYRTLIDKGYELFSKNDLRFTEQVFKLLTIEFNYKSSINIAHFLSEQYLEHKLILINDLISEVLQKGRKEKRQVSIKGQENSSNLQNVQKQESNKKQKVQIFVQKEQYLNDDDDDLIEEQPRRPEPYQKQEIPINSEIYKYNNGNEKSFSQNEQYQISKNNTFEQKLESSDEKILSYKDLPPQVKSQQFQQSQFQQQQVQAQNTVQIVQQQQPYQQNQQPYQQQQQSCQQQQQPYQQQQQSYQQQQQQQPQQQQQNGVTHQDLQKLMQVILISNENIKSVMQKFSELQTTVNMALGNFEQRLTRIEQKIRDQ